MKINKIKYIAIIMLLFINIILQIIKINVSRETLNTENYYLREFMIDEIIVLSENDYLLKMHDSAGYIWEYVTNTNDFSVNDVICVLMLKCGDKYIFDDKIVMIQFQRPDLL